MSFPVPVKTWQWDVNRTIEAQASGNAQAAEVALAIIDALTGFDQNPWEVVGSSDSVTAALDGSNRLILAANIVAAVGAHSWIVLRQPATGYSFCVDWNDATGKYENTRVFSVAAGFTGGSITARPTATDENVIESSAAWAPTQAQRQHIHVLHSTDGKVTYVFTLYRGQVLGLWWFGEAADAVTGWTSPYFGLIDGCSSNTITYDWDFLHEDTSIIKGRAPAGNMTLQLTAFGTGGSAIALLHDAAAYRMDEADHKWLILEQGLISYTASCRGRHGKMPDMWKTNEGVPSGTLFCGPGYQLVVFGGWVVPWPDDTPIEVL